MEDARQERKAEPNIRDTLVIVPFATSVMPTPRSRRCAKKRNGSKPSQTVSAWSREDEYCLGKKHWRKNAETDRVMREKVY